MILAALLGNRTMSVAVRGNREMNDAERATSIAIACGGTGGHVLPGLATAEVLMKRGHRVTLWLAGKDVEHLSAGGWDGPVVRVGAVGFPAGFSFRSISAAFRQIMAVVICLRKTRLLHPDVLLAMGSYASVGPVLAARRFRIPVVLHEANAVPGRATDLLCRSASAIAVGFPETRDYLRHPKIVFTGVPIAPRIVEASRRIRQGERERLRIQNPALDPRRFTVLVMGGSQGAHVLNEKVPSALCELWKNRFPAQVVHIAGNMEEAKVRDYYGKCGIPHVVFGFLKEMEQAYASADLAICRAGAATCAELAACGVPALFVPLAGAPRDHQTMNARALQNTGGADVMGQDRLNTQTLADYIAQCRQHPEKLEKMRTALIERAVTDGAERLADLAEQTSGYMPK